MRCKLLLDFHLGVNYEHWNVDAFDANVRKESNIASIQGTSKKPIKKWHFPP